MYSFLSKFKLTFITSDAKDKSLQGFLAQLIGKKPKNIALYKLALQHTSVAHNGANSLKESNERLEYLGDAILGAVVAEFLFKKYPYKDEGFLTEIRSRIVNRQSLNELAIKSGIAKFVRFDIKKSNLKTANSIYGDAMEALVGAVYLDLGYKACRKFIVMELLKSYFDFDKLIHTTQNYKSKIIEWAQKENKKIRFEITSENGKNHHRQFESLIYIDEEPLATGLGFSKKKAEQAAAEKSWALVVEKFL